jgi:hypothetical protein
MATINNFTNIHIRDFVQEIHHPTRPGFQAGTASAEVNVMITVGAIYGFRL